MWRGRAVSFEACYRWALLSVQITDLVHVSFCNYMNENFESAGEYTFT